MRSYIAPFDRSEIAKYISSHFPIYKFWALGSRKRAKKLASDVPDLAYRPMLLERLPDLVTNKSWSNEIYDLYTILIEGWLDREAKWIQPADLLQASFEIAHHFSCVELVDRLPRNRIKTIVENSLGVSPSWEHLSTRSLLNCDSKGRYKFAHRSVMEYLLVRMAVCGDLRALGLSWTPFMKELFVSWGHSHADDDSILAAKRILSDARSRTNLYPLYETWLGQNAFPSTNFDSLLARKTTADGYRLAPLAWRADGLEVSQESDHWTIVDSEFNINWRIIKDDLSNNHIIRLTIAEVERVLKSSEGIRLPYLDEVIALCDGLKNSELELIQDGDIFLLADRPSSKEKVILVVGNGLPGEGGVRQVGRTRAIRGNGHRINVYITGISYSHNYHKRKVRQLYVESISA